MKGYGLPRNDNVAHPDLGDIRRFGLKAGRLHPKWTANGDSKRRTRRFFKRIARREGRKEIIKSINEE